MFTFNTKNNSFLSNAIYCHMCFLVNSRTRSSFKRVSQRWRWGAGSADGRLVVSCSIYDKKRKVVEEAAMVSPPQWQGCGWNSTQTRPPSLSRGKLKPLKRRLVVKGVILFLLCSLSTWWVSDVYMETLCQLQHAIFRGSPGNKGP